MVDVDHRRHRRRLDRLGVAGGHAEGRPALGRAPIPGPSVTRAGGPSRRTTDAFLVLGHIPEHLLGGEIPLDRAGRGGGLRPAGRLGRALARGVRGRRARDRGLEPGQRDPPGDGQARARRARLRPLRLRRLGAADRLPADRHPRAADRLRPARPRQPAAPSGCWPPTCAATTCRRSCAATTSSTSASWRARCARLEAPALDDVAGREASVVRSADLRYFGQAFEIHVRRARRAGRRRPSSSRSRRASTTPTSARTATATATTPATSSSG